MLGVLKRAVKNLLRYEPLPQTAAIRETIDIHNVDGQPFCPSSEGDLIYSLITKNDFKNCLEVGFFTGSTALYIAAATAPLKGRATSICLDKDDVVVRGQALLQSEGYSELHRVIRQNSNIALPELFSSGEQYDFVFVDGWKTFDHLAFEIYLINQMLQHGGVVAFDDSHMPSVRKAIELLKSYYGYEEIEYKDHNHSLRLRLFHCLIYRSIHRPYRALKKTIKTEDQPPFQDMTFHREI